MRRLVPSRDLMQFEVPYIADLLYLLRVGIVPETWILPIVSSFTVVLGS